MFQYYHDTNHGDHILVLIPYKNTNTIGGGNGAGDGDPGLEAVLVPVVLVATIVMNISGIFLSLMVTADIVRR